MHRRRLIFFTLLACFLVSTATQAQFAHAQGKEIVDGAGKPLLLRGTNLGNWLVPEGYMWHLNDGGPESPREIEALVTELIGPQRAHEFWHSYRENYITQPAIHLLNHGAFNSIRAPLPHT